jgi:endonuclease-3 related protein
LLSLNGVGPETADSILLYAGQHSVFVIDAYTRRLASRHRIALDGATYDELRALFERALANAPVAGGQTLLSIAGAAHKPSRMSKAKRPALAQAFNDMHGFIVGIGKRYCRKSHPDCEHCPLEAMLPHPQRGDRRR